MAGSSIRTAENIAKLTKASGTTLTLASSRVNVGALQYVTSALTLNTAVSGLGGIDTGSITSSTIYYVYVVVSSGTPYLVASTNSSLPTGYSQARLLGVFLTDSASALYGLANRDTAVTGYTKRTKIITLTASDIALSTGLSNLSFKSGYMICYADSLGQWKATGNMVFTADYATGNSFALTLNNLTAKSFSGYQQPVNASTQAGDLRDAYWVTNTTTIALESTVNISGTTKYTFIDFDVWLNAEPTTYTTAAANMETPVYS